MKVFLVMYHDYDDTAPHAICSTPESAQERVDEMVAAGVPDNYEITEYELDIPGEIHKNMFANVLNLHRN